MEQEEHSPTAGADAGGAATVEVSGKPKGSLSVPSSRCALYQMSWNLQFSSVQSLCHVRLIATP